MSRALPQLTVALLLLVAGCSSGVQVPQQEGSQSELVSLVTDMNASNAQALSRMHRQALANASSYRGTYETEEDGDVTYTRDVTVDRADWQFVADWRDGDHREGEVFANASGEYRRYRTFGDEAFQYTVRTDATARFTDASRFASEVALPASRLPHYDFEYVRSDDGLYYFEADGLVDPDTVESGYPNWDTSDVANASARLVVHEDGYVRSFTASVTYDRGQWVENETAITTVKVWGVNESDAEQPHWVDRAVEEAS